LSAPEVEFNFENNAVMLHKAVQTSMRGKATTDMSTEEIIALTREQVLAKRWQHTVGGGFPRG